MVLMLPSQFSLVLNLTKKYSIKYEYGPFEADP